MADEKQPPAPPPLPGELAVDYLRRTTPTDETKLLGDDGKKVVQRARAWGQAVIIFVGALAAAIPVVVSAYRSAVEEARVRAQAAAKEAKVETQKVKNESEAGYQVARPVLEEYDRRLRALELRDRAAPAQRRGRPRPAPPPPKVLPPDLAQALKAVTAAAPPAPGPRAPAAGSGVPLMDAGVTGR